MARKQFLDYKPHFGFSIMESFEVSLQRIRRYKEPAQKFLELIGFLSNSDTSLDFGVFLSIIHPWLAEVRDNLPDYETFATDEARQGDYLTELENVSIGLRSSLTGPLRLHPLWIECIQQRAGEEGRIRWLQQILLLCHESWVRGEQAAMMPFFEKCLQEVERFQIDIGEFAEPETAIERWLEDVGRYRIN